MDTVKKRWAYRQMIVGALAVSLVACNSTVDEPIATRALLAGEKLQARSVSALTVIDHSPVAGSENQSLTRDINVTFDTPLIIESITSDSIELWKGELQVPASTVYVTDTQSLRLIPTSGLSPNETYRVVLSTTLMSVEGNLYGGAQWQFQTAGLIGETSQWTLDYCMGAAEQAWLQQVNRARSEARFCGQTFQPAVAPLSYQCTLNSAAAMHSADMAVHSLLSHLSSNGQDAFSRVRQLGYEAATLGENIAMTSESDADPIQQWLASPGHCRNIMDEVYSDLGMARAIAENGETYWTQNLSAPASPSLAIEGW
jgi:uncharacterized protein YkwD